VPEPRLMVHAGPTPAGVRLTGRAAGSPEAKAASWRQEEVRAARRGRPLAPRSASTITATDAIGRQAVIALHEELALYPKPGLVSRVDSGSHADMDAGTFLRSLFSLRRYFPAIVRLGAAGRPFADLQACGMTAETRMLRATGGVNTHRGAVFLLGLLGASAGALLASGQSLRASSLRAMLLEHWGPALAAHAAVRRDLPGSIAARQHGLRSAAQEAALGFPVLFERVLPALEAGLRRGLSPDQARLDALFAAMAHLDDTNLARRGGRAGLAFARQAARGFLAAGGAGRMGGPQAALALHREFVSRRLSPGGAADMLAAACWLVRIQSPSKGFQPLGGDVAAILREPAAPFPC